ncbi:MAG: coproporphyrinogen dehydrogenase HemZ [Clostridiales bacterium]|nr:coproporphyrinogen dehydrogenase HemZ [Clostridiales bacterium]
MLEIRLIDHDNYYAVTDCVRLFYDHPVEDKENGRVYSEFAPDIVLRSVAEKDGSSSCIFPDGRAVRFEGEALEAKRDVRRSVYMALCEISGRTAPWGCLTGIRPTLVAGEEETPEELSRKYLVRPDKAELAFETYANEARILEAVPQDDMNIYIGVPFCPTRCEYCSFISEDISHHMTKLGLYKDALIDEIKMIAPHIRRHIRTVYMGGGTPTVFDDGDFEEVIDAVFAFLKPDKETEVTIEAGRADTISEKKLRVMRDAGISRICINPQTLKDETLKKLGRRHSVEDVLRTYKLASDMGFDVINMDLIAGLKYENAGDFVDSVKGIIDLAPANITVHTLYKKRRARMSYDDVLDRDSLRGSVDDAVSEGYRLIKEAGYIPYYMYRQKDTGHGLENTGFAKPGSECLYNVAMMTDARDVLSFGAGSVSKRVWEQVGTAKYRVERCSSIKDALGYIRSVDETAQKKIDFFEL